MDISIRALGTTSVEPAFLLNVAELTKVVDRLPILGDSVNRNDVIMYMADGAPYMRKSGKKIRCLLKK